MEEVISFFSKFGIQFTVIAIAGIVILGIMKYCNLFAKFEETTRHFMYIGISVTLSLIASIIYMLCIHQLTVANIFAVAGAIYALNQAWYNIFKATTLNDLIKSLLDKLIKFLDNKSAKQ